MVSYHMNFLILNPALRWKIQSLGRYAVLPDKASFFSLYLLPFLPYFVWQFLYWCKGTSTRFSHRVLKSSLLDFRS